MKKMPQAPVDDDRVPFEVGWRPLEGPETDEMGALYEGSCGMKMDTAGWIKAR